MPRTFVVKTDMDIKSLSGSLLDARFSGAQAEAALQQLKLFNPHADLAKLRAGTVLFVPDTPGFKATAGTTTQTTPLQDFGALLAGALGDAARSTKAGNAARAAERADVAAILKSAAFKRIVGTDKDLAKQADDAQKAIASEEADDKQAEETVAAMSKAAAAALAGIGKLVG
jgi:hypothetical protein